jgi:L-fucose isomerase-like protein
MKSKKTTFALYFGTRGLFPSSLIRGAREEMSKVLKGWGYETIMLDESATKHGAVESTRDGEVYAKFLKENEGKFGGVILCLPNFGDETGAIAALKEAGVPILIQGYPDDMDKMAPEVRRDAFCGKFSVMDVFCQYGLKFTALAPHVVLPTSDRFKDNVIYFDKVCRVTHGMKGLVVGAIGARTTAFKTVRIDEIALQRHDITMETLDLTDVFARVKSLSGNEEACKDKAEKLKGCASWKGVPDKAFETITKLGVALDQVIDEYQMDAMALRCWVELQAQLNISPCVLMGELNDRGITSACEVDVGNAVAMHALSLASGGPSTCLDWNNNYGDDDNKCILFHCGPVPPSMMVGKGQISDHAILANVVGKGCSYGCNEGRIAPADITFGSMVTEAGELDFYLGEGVFTEDQIPKEFFGCAGVAHIDKLQELLLHVGRNGYRHHVSVTCGNHMGAVREALEYYLGFNVVVPQNA